MDQSASLIERYFTSRNGELSIGGVPASHVAGQYGTPLFVYDRSVIDKKWDLLRNALPVEFSIFYSVKANPSRAILKCLLAKGTGLEIASGGEFYHALNAGCLPDRIIFAGPGKTEAELDLAVGRGIREIHVESLREAERIAGIAQIRGVRARVALRVNPSAEAEGGAMRMGGRPAPFGVDEESLDDVLDRLLSFPTLDFRGIHLFTGTQILDFEVLVSQYRK
jgi:diaminopimelate decarboxylase